LATEYFSEYVAISLVLSGTWTHADNITAMGLPEYGKQKKRAQFIIIF
jgi:hypothetical protein